MVTVFLKIDMCCVNCGSSLGKTERVVVSHDGTLYFKYHHSGNCCAPPGLYEAGLFDLLDRNMRLPVPCNKCGRLPTDLFNEENIAKSKQTKGM